MPSRTAWCAVFLLLFGADTPAHAQAVAGSFEQLKAFVSPGDKVTVHDSAGTTTTGRIDVLSSSTLTILTNSGSRRFQEGDVVTIRRHRYDSLAGGAAMGVLAAVGFAAGVLAVHASSLDTIPGAAIRTALVAGAGVGVGLEALVMHPRVVYERPKRPGGITVSPLVARGETGAALSFVF